MNGGRPAASVLTAGVDHPPEARKQIGALFAQTAPASSFEVIYIEPVERREFREALREHQRRHPAGPHFHYEAIPGGSRAQLGNAAIAIAQGDVLIFVADDFVVPPGFVEAHLRLHRARPEAEVVGIGGAVVRYRNREGFYRWMEQSGELFGVPLDAATESVPADFFYGANASVKRSFLQACGGFDEDFPFDCWDDYELGQRMARQGLQAVYVPEAMAEHDHPFTLQERCRAMRRLGYSAAVHERKYPEESRAWEKRLRRSPAAWRARAWRRRLRYAVTGNGAAQAAYYRALFNSHFVRGYRLAKAGKPPSSV